MSRQPITATPAAPPRYSLVGVAQALTGVNERLFGTGWTTNPEVCGVNRGGIVQAECGGDTEALTAPNNPNVVGGDPFVVWAADECSTLGYQARDFPGRAMRMLLASQSFWIAGQIAGGGIDSGGQKYFTDGSAVVATDGTETDAAAVLAKVEEAMALKLRGERGMVHVTPAVLDQLAAEVAIRLDGTLWVTPTGNVVVADAGYIGPFDGEDGVSTMFGTSMISLGLDTIMTVPGTEVDAQSVDRAINLVTLYAERSWFYVWDECCLIEGDVPAFTGLSGGGGGGGGGGLTDAELRESPLDVIAVLANPELVYDGVRTADHHIDSTVGYSGFTVWETSGTDPASIIIHAGSDASGGVIDLINLAPSESAREYYVPALPTGGDIFIEVVSGAVQIVVRYTVG